MAVPVQTWGSLGTMVAEQKEFGTKTAEYLESNEVYDLFSHLLRQVIIHQPDNPIRFLQQQLRAKPPFTVCVIGPPGINRTKYCQGIETDFKVKHIHVGRILRNSKKYDHLIEMGELVDDDAVIKIVKEEIAKAAATGWVLNGYPRTKVQAQALALKETGYSLDKIILLNTSEKAIRQRYASAEHFGALRGTSEKEDLINTRLQQYQRHVVSIVELFQNVIRQIEVSSGEEEEVKLTYNIIKSNLHVRPHSNAPLRPHRVCIVGPCGSGRSTQCRALARQYGLVHVDPASLLRDRQSARGQPVEEVPPEHVGDEELCMVVGQRLSETDCLRKGWILDGFPKTKSQAEFLRQSHLWPTRLVHLKLEMDEVLGRVACRRIDPMTCTAYYKSPQSVAIRQRLVQAPYDEAENVQARYRMHADSVNVVLHAFPLVSSTVRGDPEISEVTKHIATKIDTPLPSELGQDPDNAQAEAS